MMDDNERVKQLTSIVLRQEKDILCLNKMLRETGYGQGQIDAYAAICEENDRLKQQIALQNKDWCEEDDAVKQLVRGILLDEQIDGDTYGVPGVVNIVEMLVDEIKMLKKTIARKVKEIWEFKQKN